MAFSDDFDCYFGVKRFGGDFNVDGKNLWQP